MVIEREYEMLKDGTIYVNGCPWELRLNSKYELYDADGIVVGFLSDDLSRAILVDDLPRFE